MPCRSIVTASPPAKYFVAWSRNSRTPTCFNVHLDHGGHQWSLCNRRWPRLHHAEGELGGVRNHGEVPGGIEDDVDVGALELGELEKLVLDLGSQHVAHAAARGGERHIDVHLVTTN